MKLNEISTPELTRVIAATSRDAGPDSREVRILERELERREAERRREIERDKK